MNLEAQISFLEEFFSMVKNMRCIGRKVLLPFQKGNLQSISSLKNLFNDLKGSQDIKYSLTARLNQDSLENLFSQIWHRGGLRGHPSPMNALMRLRMMILGRNHGAVQSNTNTQTISEEFMVEKVLSGIKANFSPKVNSTPILISTTTSTGDESVMTTGVGVSIKEEASQDGLDYLAGWIAKKFKARYPELGKFTTHKEVNEEAHCLPSWIAHLSFGGLVVPSEMWKMQVMKMENLKIL